MCLLKCFLLQVLRSDLFSVFFFFYSVQTTQDLKFISNTFLIRHTSHLTKLHRDNGVLCALRAAVPAGGGASPHTHGCSVQLAWGLGFLPQEDRAGRGHLILT